MERDVTDPDLWEVMDRTIFGTNDPRAIRAQLEGLREELRVQQSSLGHYLRSLRELRGLSVEAMAEAALVSSERWSSWERDEEVPGWELLRTVCYRLEWGRQKQLRLRAFLEGTAGSEREVL